MLISPKIVVKNSGVYFLYRLPSQPRPLRIFSIEESPEMIAKK